MFLDLNLLLDGMISKSSEGGPAKYTCHTCGIEMGNKSKMRRHAEVHLNMTHNCIVCHKNFGTRNALSTHYTRYHGHEVVSPWTTNWKLIINLNNKVFFKDTWKCSWWGTSWIHRRLIWTEQGFRRQCHIIGFPRCCFLGRMSFAWQNANAVWQILHTSSFFWKYEQYTSTFLTKIRVKYEQKYE